MVNSCWKSEPAINPTRSPGACAFVSLQGISASDGLRMWLLRNLCRSAGIGVHDAAKISSFDWYRKTGRVTPNAYLPRSRNSRRRHYASAEFMGGRAGLLQAVAASSGPELVQSGSSRSGNRAMATAGEFERVRPTWEFFLASRASQWLSLPSSIVFLPFWLR